MTHGQTTIAKIVKGFLAYLATAAASWRVCRIANQSCLAVVLASFREVQSHAASEKAVVDNGTVADL